MGWKLINRLAPSDQAYTNMLSFLRILPAVVAKNVEFGKHCNVTPLADRVSLMMLAALGDEDWDAHVLWALVVSTCFIHNSTALKELLANWAQCPKTSAGRAESLRKALATLGNTKSPLSQGLLTGTLGMLQVKKGMVIKTQIVQWVADHEELGHFQLCAMSIARCPAFAKHELQKWLGLAQFRAEVCTRLLGLWFPVNCMASANIGFGAAECFHILGGNLVGLHHALVNDPKLKEVLEGLAMLGLPWTLQCTEHMLCELRKVCSDKKLKLYVERPGFQVLFAQAQPALDRLSKRCEVLPMSGCGNSSNTEDTAGSCNGSSCRISVLSHENAWGDVCRNLCLCVTPPAKRCNLVAASPIVQGPTQAVRAAEAKETAAAVTLAAFAVFPMPVPVEHTSSCFTPMNVFVYLQDKLDKLTQERDAAVGQLEQLQTPCKVQQSEQSGT